MQDDRLSLLAASLLLLFLLLGLVAQRHPDEALTATTDGALSALLILAVLCFLLVFAYHAVLYARELFWKQRMRGITTKTAAANVTESSPTSTAEGETVEGESDTTSQRAGRAE